MPSSDLHKPWNVPAKLSQSSVDLLKSPANDAPNYENHYNICLGDCPPRSGGIAYEWAVRGLRELRSTWIAVGRRNPGLRLDLNHPSIGFAKRGAGVRRSHKGGCAAGCDRSEERRVGKRV